MVFFILPWLMKRLFPDELLRSISMFAATGVVARGIIYGPPALHAMIFSLACHGFVRVPVLSQLCLPLFSACQRMKTSANFDRAEKISFMNVHNDDNMALMMVNNFM